MNEDRRAIVQLVLSGKKMDDLSTNQKRVASRMVADGELRLVGDDQFRVTPKTLTALTGTRTE